VSFGSIYLGNPLAWAFPAARVGLYVTIFFARRLRRRAKKDFHCDPYCEKFAAKKPFFLKKTEIIF
jgi:hypothetical protein